jgi:hypothetical protein
MGVNWIQNVYSPAAVCAQNEKKNTGDTSTVTRHAAACETMYISEGISPDGSSALNPQNLANPPTVRIVKWYTVSCLDPVSCPWCLPWCSGTQVGFESKL